MEEKTYKEEHEEMLLELEKSIQKLIELMDKQIKLLKGVKK